MKALVVYDSVFGNTEKVAQAIGEALGAQTLRLGDVQPEHLADLDALVVGSPTRAFSATPAIKKWLNGIAPRSLQGVKVAAFDTRMNVQEVNSRILTFLAKIFGYAAEPMASRLIKKGGTQAMPPAGFFVEGSEGPLKGGELERAVDWAKHLIAA